ncbi:outer membrane transport energization protein ExbD [Balneicella halophila]|uniref:Outer membrane transport energization protein ExbD n=1 Tax=Balneicella halophila TaxID=1537566 RepID=A0A7L4UQP5_BALHA|nr:biopolymer transporter ExbD [Balneicella halophila]PVX51989.1 outer membrane transport energization protein ExbD [Balneicella halophila]
MAISPRNKIDPNFSVSSMTDIIFLLLIFFMVSSTFIQTKGIMVDKPESKTATSEPVIVIISIDKDGEYFYEQERASLQEIESKLALKKRIDKDVSISVNAEKTVPIQKLVNLMDIARRNELKIVLATK